MFIAHKTVFNIRPCTKALYTLATVSIVAETANKSATKSTVAHIRSTLLPIWQHIGNNLNSTACRGRLCCRYGELCRQCVRGRSNTVDFVNEVDRVEFNFVQL